LIDTPGFGDTRGMSFDKKGLDKIKKIVVDEGGINCVCVV